MYIYHARYTWRPGGDPPVSLLPPLLGDGVLLMLSVLALGVKNTWGGSMGEWGWSKGSGTDAFTRSNSCSGAETGWCPGGSGRGCRMASPCSLGAAWAVLVFWHPMGFRGRLEGPGSPFLSVGEERRHGLQRGMGWFSSQATAAWERECAGAYGGGSWWWDSPRRWRQKSAREPGAGREAVQHRGCSRLELGKPWGLCGDKG